MACSFSYSFCSRNKIKEKQSKELVGPLGILFQSIPRLREMKMPHTHGSSKCKLIVQAHKKRCCKPNQLLWVCFLHQNIHICKVSGQENTRMVSEFSNIGENALSTKYGNGLESSDVEKDTLKSLDWESVCNQVAKFTNTIMGSMVAKEGSLPIGSNQQICEELLDQTTAALLLPDALDFSGIQDIRKIIGSAVSGAMCTVHELCAVKETLHAARNISDHLYSIVSERKTCLDGQFMGVDAQNRNLFHSLLNIMEGACFCSDLENELGHCLDCTLLTVLDRASPALENIRTTRRSNMGSIETLLKETASKIAEARGIDSPLITKRRSRLCVGVKASHKSLLPGGIVLDVSTSGATYFMEPKDVLDLNNMEVQLAAAEQSEEFAILDRLTSRIAGEAAALINVLERIKVLDLACARAGYARWLGAVRPIFCQKEGNSASGGLGGQKIEISESDSSCVDIEGIRHPLLLDLALQKRPSLPSSTRICSSIEKWDSNFEKIESDIVSNSDENRAKFPVPIDFKIGTQKKVVVISGPNTGGKTATMKTLGIAVLMAKAGLFLPAHGQPRLPWFDHVMADIGDSQSLEQSLSTYSGHIRRLCKILELGTSQSLVLIDEIGSGTDPSEGVAISTSILQHLAGHVSLTVVTTHHADLSHLKDKDNRFENAAMGFDIKTLQPTYRILWATVGQSNALDIAHSLGFDPKVLNCAWEWVMKLAPDRQKERKGGLFQSLIKQRDELQDQARTVAAIITEAMELYNELLAETQDLDKCEAALKLMEEEALEMDVKIAKDRMDEIISNFEKQLYNESAEFSGIFIKEALAAVASIVQEYCPNATEASQGEANSPAIGIPDIGDKVLIKRLGSKPAIIAEAPSKEDGRLLVQLGKLKFRVKTNEVEKIVSSKETGTTVLVSARQEKGRDLSGKRKIRRTELPQAEELKFDPAIQTSRNTLDLRGMRVEDAIRKTDITIASTRPFSTLFVIHGMGTGAVKEAVLSMLKTHPRVVKFAQESPMNFGCTMVYIK